MSDSPTNPDLPVSVWTIHVCPECGKLANTCDHVERGPDEPIAVEVVPKVERDRYREALEQIGQMVGARANGADARAVARVARAALDEEQRDG